MRRLRRVHTENPYTDLAMHRRQQRPSRTLLALLLVIGLVLLFVSGASSHGSNGAWIVFLPVLLFGLVTIPCLLWLPPEASLVTKHQTLARTSLFQRPPPAA